MSSEQDTAWGRVAIERRTGLAWRLPEDRAAAGTPHPRAASGLVALGDGRLAVVQDDACSIALVDPASGLAEAVPLPPVGGHRRFDPGHGEKRLKPDFESLARAAINGREVLLAFGSGSTGARESVAIIERLDGPGGWSARSALASGLYRALRAIPDYDGGALNVEGAVVVGADVWLFQRGNGGAHPAVASVALSELWAHLHGGPAPVVGDVMRVPLGAIDGVPLGFTDAAMTGDGRIVWLASAEASPSTYDDGVVVGSAVGILDDPARRALIVERDGTIFAGKAEGLAFLGERAFIAVDPDDPERPAELLELSLAAIL